MTQEKVRSIPAQRGEDGASSPWGAEQYGLRRAAQNGPTLRWTLPVRDMLVSRESTCTPGEMQGGTVNGFHSPLTGAMLRPGAFFVSFQPFMPFISRRNSSCSKKRSSSSAQAMWAATAPMPWPTAGCAERSSSPISFRKRRRPRPWTWPTASAFCPRT